MYPLKQGTTTSTITQVVNQQAMDYGLNYNYGNNYNYGENNYDYRNVPMNNNDYNYNDYGSLNDYNGDYSSLDEQMQVTRKK